MKHIIPLFIFMTSCMAHHEPLEVVADVSLERYAGTWYEIARFPHFFEKDLDCVTATYILRADGRIDVLNQGRKISSPTEMKSAKGVAWIPDPSQPAKLHVRFFWPFYGKYWILQLDPDYRYALVGHPSRKYLWILAREKKLDDSVFNALTEKAQQLGFDTGKLERVNQECD